MNAVVDFLKGRKTLAAGGLLLFYLSTCYVNKTVPNPVLTNAGLVAMIMFLRDGMNKKK